jgi:hypothetical protein
MYMPCINQVFEQHVEGVRGADVGERVRLLVLCLTAMLGKLGTTSKVTSNIRFIRDRPPAR